MPNATLVGSVTGEALTRLAKVGVQVQESLWRETVRWAGPVTEQMALEPWMVTRRYLNLLSDRLDEIGHAEEAA